MMFDAIYSSFTDDCREKKTKNKILINKSATVRKLELSYALVEAADVDNIEEVLQKYDHMTTDELCISARRKILMIRKPTSSTNVRI